MAFGGLVITNRGRNLQAKAQLGAQLAFTRIAMGDGELGGSSIVDLTALKNQVASLALSTFTNLGGGKASVGAVFSNQGVAQGFYWREIGLFAQDPDLGEILYCYGNAGGTAEYIPAGGGPDIVEKRINIDAIIGNASSVSATIEQSLVFVAYTEFQETVQNLNEHVDAAAPHIGHETPTGAQAKVDAHVAVASPHSGHATTAALTAHTGATAPHSGHETPAGAQAKVDAHASASTPHSGHATTAALSAHTGAATPHSGHAPLASPAFSGNPTAPTAVVGTNTTQLATTAFVMAQAPHTRQIYSGDVTEVSVVGTVATTRKSTRIIKSTANGLNVTRLGIVAELRATAGTAFLDVFVNSVLLFTLQTTSTSYAVVQNNAAVAWADNSVNLVEIKLRNSASNTTFNRVLEMYV